MASDEVRSIFWDDLAEDLEDPIFREIYDETSAALAATHPTVSAGGATGQADH